MEKESEQQDIPMIVEPAEESVEKHEEDDSQSDEDNHLPAPPPTSKRMSIRWNPGGASGRMSVEKNSIKLNPPMEERDDTKSVRSIRFEDQETHRTSVVSHQNDIQEEEDEIDDSDSDEYVPPPNFPGARKTSLMWAPPGFESQTSIGRRMSGDLQTVMHRGLNSRENSGSGVRRNSSMGEEPIPGSKLSIQANNLQNQQPSIVEIGKRSTTTSPEGKDPLKGSRSSGYHVPLEAKVTRRKQSLSQNELNRSKDLVKGSLMDLASESAKGSTTLKRMAYYAPFIQWFFDTYARLIELYFEHVSFKMECLLQLFVLLPFVLLGLILYYMDVAILPDLYVELSLKVGLVVIGQLAEYSVSIVNQRHAEITCMAKIVTNSATARDIFETIAGKRVNKILKYSGMSC
jgi:hypothetical protein